MLKSLILPATIATTLLSTSLYSSTSSAIEGTKATPVASVKVEKSTLSKSAQDVAEFAVKTYQHQMVESLAKLIKHNTVAVEGVKSTENPAHIAFKEELKRQALALGLDFTDHGYVLIVGLGNSEERVGIITHGDVQPVNENKWQKSPFDLDVTSEPGKLIGRGTEDDKGPIATAMYAMKAIKDNKLPLTKRLELYVYMAEESDWDPLREYVKNNILPATNITIDAEYPVVTAEKGYGTIALTFPERKLNPMVKFERPYLSSFTGGFFNSQIPEDAKAVIENASFDLLQQLMSAAEQIDNVGFDFEFKDQQLTITALGKSAHSSKPEDGINAITHLAQLIDFQKWPSNQSGMLVNFINQHLGTQLYGERFGEIAYENAFMGRMTVSPTVIKQTDKGVQLRINLRRPVGKTAEQLEQEIAATVKGWEQRNNTTLSDTSYKIGEPWVQKNAPHVDTLLSVFSHYTGIKNPQPVAIGGGTNSRLFPNAVSFGPSMPNTPYSGHSEHEFITMEQFVLNLRMYTAVMIELATK